MSFAYPVLRQDLLDTDDWHDGQRYEYLDVDGVHSLLARFVDRHEFAP